MPSFSMHLGLTIGLVSVRAPSEALNSSTEAAKTHSVRDNSQESYESSTTLHILIVDPGRGLQSSVKKKVGTNVGTNAPSCEKFHQGIGKSCGGERSDFS